MSQREQNNVEYFEKLGRRLRDLRIKNGYSSHESFAYDANISRSQYWRYENGTDLKLSTLLVITKSLNITLAEFFSEGFE